MSVTPGTDARRSLSVMAPEANIWSRSQCQPLAPISVERGGYGRGVGGLVVWPGGRGALRRVRRRALRRVDGRSLRGVSYRALDGVCARGIGARGRGLRAEDCKGGARGQ